MAGRIHHVQIAMPEGGEEDARQFYGAYLGFPEIPKPATLAKRGGAWFQTGNLQIHLGVDRAFTPATKAHVAYEVEDLDTVKEHLEAGGSDIVDDELLPGYDRFYVNDPFGNRVEILKAR